VSAPASGGGLMAGIALAIHHHFPQARLFTAEPESYDDHARSFASGQRQRHQARNRTFCDALMAPEPGELTFAINRKLVAGGVTATDAEVTQAMAFAFRELKLVAEPGGSVALAALLAGRMDVRGKTVVIVLSGGNVDAGLYADAIREGAV
jgi:threonine dehydratase